MIRRHSRFRKAAPPSPMPKTTSMGDLAVISCHFNWPGFVRPRQNLRRFLRHTASMGVPVFGVEAVLPGQIPQTLGEPGWTQVEADPACQVMFQKEALLNLAERTVPEQFTKLAWIDTDLMFENLNWAADTSLLLNHFPFVQPFEAAVWTDIDGSKLFSKSATMKMRGGLPMKSHPGFATACRRSTWRNIGGLYDRLVVGSGDMATAVGILNMTMPASQTYSKKLMADFMVWKDRVVEEVKAQYSWVPGAVYHEWHGERALRKYAERHKVSAALDPVNHITLGPNGLLSWTDKAPKWMRKYVSGYFVSRQEDGTPKKSR